MLDKSKRLRPKADKVEERERESEKERDREGGSKHPQKSLYVCTLNRMSSFVAPRLANKIQAL